MLANRILQRRATFHEFRPRLLRRFENQQRMRERVIADKMSRLRHRARNIGSLLHVASNHKNVARTLCFAKNVKQLQRMRIVRPIIVSQRNLLDFPRIPPANVHRTTAMEPSAPRAHSLAHQGGAHP